MKITYIHHSSFCIETACANYLFDYYKGDIPKLNPEKPLYVFASHKHGDHFSPVIFHLKNSYPNIHYILSDDIKIAPEQNITSIGPNSRIQLYGMEIETLKSTDEGVAFLISKNGFTIYFAGDLNWWRWNGETDSYNQNMQSMFLKEMEKIRGRTFDFAFLPLDPRQEDNYLLGMDAFCQYADAAVIFPMHFWGDYSIIKKAKNDIKTLSYRNKIISLSHEGENFQFEKDVKL